MIKGTDGIYYGFFGIKNTKPLIELKLSETLDGTGTKVITLDTQFVNCALIDASHPIFVSITLTSNLSSANVWVDKSTSPTSITVHGPALATFDICISAINLNQAKLQSFETEEEIPMGITNSVSTIFDRIYSGSITLEIINSNEVYIQEP
jgi:hypothetical protein